MDLIMALSPINLIRTLNRPRREKILVGCLMALGLLTVVVAGVKMTTFTSIYQGDILQGQLLGSVLTKLEEQIGLICACLPTLKGPVERLLIRIGVLSRELRQNFTRPSFVMSTRHRAPPAAPSAMSPPIADHNGFDSTTDTLWLDGSKLTVTISGSGNGSVSRSPSERTMAATSSKASIQNVEEV
jgi:hypothetical protein